MSNDTPNSTSSDGAPGRGDPNAGPEGTTAAGDAAAPASTDRAAQLEAEVASLKDQVLRALAEAENTRRRAQREIEDNNKYAVTNFAREMLPVADNLRRALEAIPAEARAADAALAQFATGVELTERELLNALDRFHIKRVDPLGQPFDHNLHQAVVQVDAPDKPAGTVMQVLQPGYTLHGRLLRPAMVAVSKGDSAGGGGGKVDTTA
jgi:molecular chaperone GrpE